MSQYNAFASFYDRLTQNIPYQKRGEYFHLLLQRYAPQKANPILLDLACGTGTLTFIMEDFGYDMIGIDNSYAMLSQAMDKKAERQSNALFLCQPMQDLNLFGTIDAALCALDSLNHLTNPLDVLHTFQKISLFLDEDGIFLFDVNTPYKHKQILGNNTFVYDYGDLYCVWQNSLHGSLVQMDLDLFSSDDGKTFIRQEESFAERAYTQEELADLLAQAGLAIVARFEEDSLSPPTDHSQRVVYVTRNQVTKNARA